MRKLVDLNDFTLVCDTNGDLYIDTEDPAGASPFELNEESGDLWFDDTPFYKDYYYYVEDEGWVYFKEVKEDV